MDGNSINVEAAPIQHSRPEQDSYIGNQEDKNSTRNEIISERIDNVTNKMMIPTPLEYSYWSRHRSLAAFCAFSVFTSLSIAVGVLTLCFTSPKVAIEECDLKFIKTTENPIEYNSGPRSVAVGDFNNDTCLDIVVANDAVDLIVVFIGFCDGTFQRYITYSTGTASDPRMVAVADFNNDYRLDIAVANFGTNNIGIFIGFGNGFFEKQTVISTNTSRPLWINIDDLNNDTIMDIVIANYGTHSISVLYGYGNGTFSHAIIYSTGYDSLPISVATGDFNNDNRIDIVVPNYGTNNLGILLRKTDGTFANQRIVSTGSNSHPYSITVGFFNDDTLLDIAVANSGTNKIGVLLGYGNGTFTSQTTYSLGITSPHSIGVGDLNKDNRMDLVVANQGINNIVVLIGYGNGTFASPTNYSTGSFFSSSVIVCDLNNDNLEDITFVNNDTNSIGILLGYYQRFTNQVTYPQSLALGDFNNDTRLDIPVVNYLSDNISALIRHDSLGLVNGITFASGAGSRLRSIAAADLNKDNRLDIIVANYGTNTVGILLGKDNGTFEKQITFSTDSNSHPSSIAVGHFNDDTLLDIAVANNGMTNVDIIIGNGNGTFTIDPNSRIYSNLTPFVIAVGDLNKDGRSEIVLGYMDSDSIAIFLAYDSGSFKYQATYSTDDSPYSVAVGDLNNDNRLDIVVVSLVTPNVGVLLGYGNGSFANQVKYSTGTFPRSVAVCDFNNDTRLDIVVANGADDTISVLLGYGDGTFENQRVYSTDSSPQSVAFGDFNSDKWLDIVVANSGSDTISILFGYGNGSFGNEKSYPSGSYPQSLAVGDFNNDTRLDIVVANGADETVSVLLGYGNGSFENEMTYSSGSTPQSVALGDLNNDTRMDIVVANRDNATVSILLGYGNGSFAHQVTYSTGSSPQSVAVGDFNKDTRLDIVVANSGDNTVSVLIGYGNGSFSKERKYVSGRSPYSVAVGDLNNDSRLDIVVTNFVSGNVDVFVGYSDTTFVEQMLVTSVNGSRPRSFAIADFNNDDQMDIAVANSGINNLAIFLGYGNCSFANPITYSTGCSPQSIAVGDLNNDTRLDIVVVNTLCENVFILIGDGNGSFEKQITYPTGSNSQPYSLAVGDFDNDSFLDIVIANHGANNVVVLRGFGNGTFATLVKFSTGYESFPFSVIVGDFNNDRKLDLAVANGGTDNLKVFLQSC